MLASGNNSSHNEDLPLGIEPEEDARFEGERPPWQ